MPLAQEWLPGAYAPYTDREDLNGQFMRIEHEDLQEASETLHEILSLMEKGPTREFVEMCENMDIDGESAIETITIALEATNGDAAEASGYVFLIAIIAARKALGREAEADAA